MAKRIRQIEDDAWEVAEDIVLKESTVYSYTGDTVTYTVYDNDPNVDKYAHEFKRLSVADTESIKESLGISGGSVKLTSGEGIDVVDNGDGSYIINSTVRGGASGSSGSSGASGSSGTSGSSGSSGTSGINGITGGHVLTKPVTDRTYSARLNGTPSYSYTSTTRDVMSLYPFIPANTLTIKNLKINVASATASAWCS